MQTSADIESHACHAIRSLPRPRNVLRRGGVTSLVLSLTPGLVFGLGLAALPAILIVWTYRDPRELVVALGLTSLTSVAYGAFLFWAFVG